MIFSYTVINCLQVFVILAHLVVLELQGRFYILMSDFDEIGRPMEWINMLAIFIG